RKEIRIIERGRVISHFEVGRRSFAGDLDAALSELLRLPRERPLRYLTRRQRPEMMCHTAECLLGLHVANDDERGVIREIVTTVVPEQIVARHRLQVAEPTDRRMTVWMRVEGGGHELLIEQLIRIVFAALKLRDDHGPL